LPASSAPPALVPELGDGGNDVLVPVQDQQEVRLVDLLVHA
jgi:hypothetical protein